MTIKPLILASTMLLASATAAPQLGTLKPQINQEYQDQLNTILDSLREVTGVPGFSVSAVHEGVLVGSATSGYADVQSQTPVNRNTLFRLASVSKIVGATMLGELVTQDKLSADSSIGDFYPELNTKYHNITLRELMSHTSGMPHYQTKDYDIYDKHYTSAIQALETLKERDLLTRPGYEYHYSTHGFTLAGAILEKVVSTPLPLALEQFNQRWTGAATPVAEDVRHLAPNTSSLYEITSNGSRVIKRGEKSYSILGAGMLATSDDLAQFGYRVLEKTYRNSLLESLLFTPAKTKNGTNVTYRDFDVGFGWRIGNDMHGRKVYHHAGATPGARSILVIYPEHSLSIAFLSNSSWVSSIDKLAFALASLYLDKAKAIDYSAINFRVKYGDDFFIGSTDCHKNKCALTDGKTEYSKWLNTFNKGATSISSWPIFSYLVKGSQRLLMINKVGITSFDLRNGVFETSIGKAQDYKIEIKPAGHQYNEL